MNPPLLEMYKNSLGMLARHCEVPRYSRNSESTHFPGNLSQEPNWIVTEKISESLTKVSIVTLTCGRE